MVSEEQLDAWRVAGTRIKVVRDSNPANDVRGIVVAWDEQHVLLRKQNRKVVKLDRSYEYTPLVQS